LSQGLQKELVEYILLDIEIDFLYARSAEYDRIISRFKSSLSARVEDAVMLERLQEDLDRYREIYDILFQHSQYAVIKETSETIEMKSGYTIVKPAELPLNPISPDRVNLFSLALALGLALGAGIIYFKTFNDDSFKKLEDVEGDLEINVMATIPRMQLPYSGKNPDLFLKYSTFIIGFALLMIYIVLRLNIA
jgi:uncharacterized protein involved in exopolysaccharide biosynthesis